ncbi:MAG: ATP-binding protein [Chitinophagales bacterium]
MRIKSLSYKSADWEIDNLQLSEVNLIVGQNAVGKSRTLQAIDLLVKMITQEKDLRRNGKWNILLEDNTGKTIKYQLNTKVNQLVVLEEIWLDSELVLSRKSQDNYSKIKNYLSKENEEYIYPPYYKLVIHANRDTKKYPFLEHIAQWAEQFRRFNFGNIRPKANLFTAPNYGLLTTIEDILNIFKSLKSSDKEIIIANFNKLNYSITDISLKHKNTSPILFVKEKGISKRIPHPNLSQGMFRALAMTIYLQYLINRQEPATIIIDDLCEGLDYERSMKLGKFLFKTALAHNIQLIATSNDNFLMEVASLKYLNVLIREGKKVRGINIHSHPQVFEDFKFTGLSNFDFFSSSYLNSVQL